MKLLFLPVLLAVLCLVPASAVFNGTLGIPYVQVNYTRSGPLDEQLLREYVRTWAAAQAALVTAASGITADHVRLDSLASSGDDHTFEAGVWGEGIRNVEAIPAMQKFVVDLNAGGVFPSDYVISGSAFSENPGPIEFNFDPLGGVYFGHRSAPLRAFLTQAPPLNKQMTFSVRSQVTGAFDLEVSTLTFTFPMTELTFYANAKDISAAPGIDVFLMTQAAVTNLTADQRALVSISPSVLTNLLSVTPLAVVEVYPMAAGFQLYDDQYSPADINLRVPDHLQTTFDLVVTPVFEPSNLTASPANVTITAARTFVPFKVRGPVGSYNLSFRIAPAFVDAFGNDRGKNNGDFVQPADVLALEVNPRLIVAFSSVPDAYLANPVSSDSYGGAYETLTATVSGSPNHAVTATIEPPSQMDVTPLSHTFVSSGPTTLTFQLRSHVIGLRELRFQLSGQSRGDYVLQAVSREWNIHGRNPNCGTPTDSAGCLGMNGCFWSQERGRCFNSSLPLRIDPIHLLYSTEPSPSVKVDLPTPVRNDLRIVFTPMSRFVITPAVVRLSAGDSSFNFVVTGTWQTGDPKLWSETVWMRMEGTDANVYVEERVVVTLRPQIACVLQPPINGFFVRTFSDVFVLSCDTPTASEVIFTPATTTLGIVFQPNTPDPRDLSSLFFAAGQERAEFFANSTSDLTGTVSVSVGITGINAPRYAPIVVTTFRVLEAGVLNIPPRFYLMLKQTSAQFHLDLSVQPPTLLEVTAKVFDENGGEVSDDVVVVSPNPAVFNNSMRSTFNVTGMVIGSFYMNFTMSGAHQKNYDVPTARLNFTVQDAVDGPASTARMTPGFLSMRRTCRINVGLRSVRFRGQDRVELPENICADLTPTAFANATVDCAQYTTGYKCRRGLETSGNACAWVNETCMHFPVLQGRIKSFQFGSDFTVFLDKNGTVWTTGIDRYGQLGHQGSDLRTVTIPSNSSVEVIACGSNHVLVLTAEGTVFAWGANHQGQLGINQRDSFSIVPLPVSFPSTSDNITCLSSGFLHAAAVSTSGQVFTWGSNEFGQLGMAANYRGTVNRPVVLTQDAFGGDPIQVAQLGEYHTMVATDNSAYTCGNNNQGQLGREGFDDYNFKPPVLWFKNQYTTGPTWASYITGRQC